MNHRDALDSNASSRYLLGELDRTEREEFEEHYFSCVECAEDVRAGAALARGVAALYGGETKGRGWQGWFDWLSPAVLVPAGAALALAAVIAYQNLVVIPGLRQSLASAAVTATVLQSATRGEAAATVEAAAGPVAVLAMDVNGVEPGVRIGYELHAPDGSVRASGAVHAPPSGQPLLLVVRTSELHARGAWTVVIRTPAGAELGRYPFRLQLR